MSEGESELQGGNAKLQDKISELEKELSQSRDAEADLTQALGKVTIEKTRMEREIQKLKNQASDHSNDQLAEALSNNKTLKTKLDEANSKVQSLESELQTSRETISQLQSEKKALTQELDEAMKELNKERENMSKSSEELINLRSELDLERSAREKAEQTLVLAQAQREVTVMAAADVHTENKASTELESVEETDSPLPTTLGTKVVENGEVTGDETLAENMTEATQTLVEEHGQKAVGNEKEQPSTDDAVVEDKEGEKEDDVVAKAEGVTLVLTDEAKDSASEIDDEEFDKVGTLKCLDNTSALDKAQLFAKRGRKRPSRKHIQTMAHQSPFPEEMPALKVLEGSGSVAPHPTPGGTPPQKLPKPEPKPGPKPKPSELAKPQVLAPKPKPRPQPRKKPSPEHSSDAAGAQTPEVSKKPVPMPRCPSQEVTSEDVDQLALGGDKLSSPTEALSQSPIHSGKMAPAVAASRSPKASPVHVRKNENDDPPASSSPAPPRKPKPHPPKPSPRPHKPDDSKAAEEKGPDTGDSKLEELQSKDPSELTVKEKMMLAQMAMAKQAEQKSKGLPPVVRKKPPVKAPSVGFDLDEHHQRGSVHEQDMESSLERSRSMENVLEDGHNTPDQRRKLPPGAFNISIPMGLPGEMRHRSATHAGVTSPDHVKRFSKEVDNAQDDQPDQAQVLSQDSQGTPSRKSQVPETPVSEGTPQHSDSAISTPEGSRRDKVANSMGMDESEDDLDNEVEAEVDSDSLMQQVSSSSPSAKPDPEQVLFWNPEVVGMWLRNTGLGKHSSAFMEKNIKGYMLFELDSAKLKGLGVTSGDEKTVFKKEIKALRPFADKIKKEYEKTKKDEKKRADQEKKLAKRKKK